MSINDEIEALFKKERQRTAKILRLAQTTKEFDRYDTYPSALELAARHIEHGDEDGDLYVRCKPCEKLFVNVRFGDEYGKCPRCDKVLPWIP